MQMCFRSLGLQEARPPEMQRAVIRAREQQRPVASTQLHVQHASAAHLRASASRLSLDVDVHALIALCAMQLVREDWLEQEMLCVFIRPIRWS